MEQYRFHKAYIPNTRSERISDTVEFFPKQFNMPQMSSVYAMVHATQYLIYVLHNTAPEIPLFKLGNGNKEVLSTLSEIFRKVAPPPAVPPRVPVRGGHTKKNPTGEPRKNPNEIFISIKSIYQCRTYEGAYSVNIPRGSPTSALSKNPD